MTHTDRTDTQTSVVPELAKTGNFPKPQYKNSLSKAKTYPNPTKYKPNLTQTLTQHNPNPNQNLGCTKCLTQEKFHICVTHKLTNISIYWALYISFDRLKPILKHFKIHPSPTQGITFLCLNHLWSSSNFQDIFPIIYWHENC
jgi:hypothetical protein